jgi:hypothetical protein
VAPPVLFPHRPTPGSPLVVVAATVLFAASAHADPAAPAPRAPAARAAKPAPAEPPPDPELRVRVVAPSAHGPWTLHLENDGSRWLRVPADLRLLHLSIESSDTTAKRPAKPLKCALPAGLRHESFPDRNALLLGPGDSYVEAFDPRLFCFGNDARAIAGGALVRAFYGWDPPARGAKKVEGPFVVEGTAFPAAVAPQKRVVAPSLVLSYRPPEPEEEPEALPPPVPAPSTPPPAVPLAQPPGAILLPPSEPEGDPEGPLEEVAPDENAAAASPVPVDENAPRIELRATPFADAVDGFKVSLTITATNVGHRPATVAILTRMVGFRVAGPDGVGHCHAAPATHALPREAFRVLRPGGAVSLTLFVEEACRHALFRRPGLYHVTPSLHLNENGAELHLDALTGTVRAAQPSLVRVAEGPEPFYPRAPQALRAPKPEGDAPAP